MDVSLGLEARIRQELAEQASAAHREGMPLLALRGQLTRPHAAHAVALALGGEEPSSPRFWRALLAIQMVHEASLVHDDIVDGAATRRDEPTVVAARGGAAALVHGDHLLSAAYRLAAGSGSLAFVEHFARAVERTVSGEADQARLRGTELDPAGYADVASRKSGELFGIALATWPLLAGDREVHDLLELGRRIGLFYQRVDDLLDFCPAAGTGKQPLMDYSRRLWTWPLHEVPGAELGRGPREMMASFVQSGAAGRCIRRLEHEADDLLESLEARFPGDTLLPAQLLRWLDRARRAAVPSPPRPGPP